MEARPLPAGVVAADEPGGGPKDRAKWLRETLPLTGEGTDYTPPEQIVLPGTAPILPRLARFRMGLRLVQAVSLDCVPGWRLSGLRLFRKEPGEPGSLRADGAQDRRASALSCR